MDQHPRLPLGRCACLALGLLRSIGFSRVDALRLCRHPQLHFCEFTGNAHGLACLVLQKARRWNLPCGGTVDFSGLLGILSKRARELQTADSALFLRVVGIDATPKEGFRAVRAADKAKTIGVPKYADQAGNTWGGRGPRPKWLKDALASGNVLTDLLASS